MKQGYKTTEERIERFFEGETTKEEEQALYALFSGDAVPKHLAHYRPVFEFFKAGIHRESKPEGKRSPKRVAIWMSIAASALILISSGVFFAMQNREYAQYKGSYIVRNGVKITDLKIVVPEVKKTLYAFQSQVEEYDGWLRLIMEEDDIFLDELLEMISFE